MTDPEGRKFWWLAEPQGREFRWMTDPEGSWFWWMAEWWVRSAGFPTGRNSGSPAFG